jgi:hypothetical protein
MLHDDRKIHCTGEWRAARADPFGPLIRRAAMPHCYEAGTELLSLSKYRRMDLPNERGVSRISVTFAAGAQSPPVFAFGRLVPAKT